MADILGFGRLNEFYRAHPDVEVARPYGGSQMWQAWIPRQGGDRTEGTLIIRARLDELLDRLEQVFRGGLDGAAQVGAAGC